MKRWEIVKGIQEGLYPKGTRFKINYDDGDVGYAKIDQHGCLAWDMDEGVEHVHIASYNGDEWKVLHDNLKDREEVRFSVRQSQLDLLQGRHSFLECLERVGVKGWEGFQHAVELYEDEYEGKEYFID